MRPKKITNASNFPDARPTGVKGIFTFNTVRFANFGAQPPAIPVPLFAPSLLDNGYQKLITYLDLRDGVTGLPYGISSQGLSLPIYPPTNFFYNYANGNGLPEGQLVFNFKELAYIDIQNMLAGGDLLRITNMRLRYKLKFPSAEQRSQTITFFNQNIFGHPDFQQLTISQYFDPETNKTPNNDSNYFETVDIPVDFFASNTSGVCLNLKSINNSLDLSGFGGFSATFMVEHYFNHVKENKKSIL